MRLLDFLSPQSEIYAPLVVFLGKSQPYSTVWQSSPSKAARCQYPSRRRSVITPRNHAGEAVRFDSSPFSNDQLTFCITRGVCPMEFLRRCRDEALGITNPANTLPQSEGR